LYFIYTNADTQLIKLYHAGVTIQLRGRSPDSDTKGEYDTGKLEARAYPANADSPDNLAVTIIPELIHARNDVGGRRSRQSILSEDETAIEREAQDT